MNKNQNQANAWNVQPVRANQVNKEEIIAAGLLLSGGSFNLTPAQLETIVCYLNGLDTMLAAPTGSGKSFVYQLIARLSPCKVTIVMVPTVSLMHDSARHCNALGFLVQTKYWEYTHGTRALIFCAYEHINCTSFRALVKQLCALKQLSGIVVDEAHVIDCHSDFRAVMYEFRYLRLALFPILCLSATLSREVVTVLETTFETKFCQIRMPTTRYDLYTEAKVFKNMAAALNCLRNELVDWDLGREPGEKCIIFVPILRIGKLLSDALGPAVRFYNGKLERAVKDELTQSFVDGKVPIMIATSAFGMGVNASKVTRIVHFGPSYSLLDYVQEIGRGGRTENFFCRCLLLAFPFGCSHLSGDSDIIQYVNNEVFCRKIQMRKLTDLAATDDVRTCGNCDICSRNGSQLQVDIKELTVQVFNNSHLIKASFLKVDTFLKTLRRQGNAWMSLENFFQGDLCLQCCILRGELNQHAQSACPLNQGRCLRCYSRGHLVDLCSKETGQNLQQDAEHMSCFKCRVPNNIHGERIHVTEPDCFGTDQCSGIGEAFVRVLLCLHEEGRLNVGIVGDAYQWMFASKHDKVPNWLLVAFGFIEQYAQHGYQLGDDTLKINIGQQLRARTIDYFQ